MNVYDNAKKILERVERAAAGRPVTLVAASKRNDAAAIREAYRAGVRAFGENRAQELRDKDAQGAYAGAEKHFIGHLQTNKVKDVAGKVALIQSVDSLALAERIAARAPGQAVLIEVNLGGERAKSGVDPAAVRALAAACGGQYGLQVRGLMAIPPAEASLAETVKYFAQLRNLFIDIGSEKYDNVNMAILSMGMSRDFEAAIHEGATMVRVGTGIFGARDYTK